MHVKTIGIRRATENPERRAPRPLVLWSTDELPQYSPVLSEAPRIWKEWLRHRTRGQWFDVGPLYGNPTATSVVATSDPSLGGGKE